MKREWTKIEFIKERPFGKRMGATFLFLRENAAVLLRLSAGFLLPLVVIASLLCSYVMSSIFKMSVVGYLTPSALAIFALSSACALLLVLLVPSFSYSLMLLYNERDEQLRNIRFGDVLQAMKRPFIKMSCLLPFLLIIYFLFFLLQLKTSALVASISFLILFLAVGIPLLLLLPAYLLSHDSLIKSVLHSFKIGYPSWISTFSFWLTLKLIGGFVALFFAFPWIVTTYVEKAFFASSTTFDIPFTYQLIIILFSFLMIAGVILSIIFLQIGMAYQYAHAVSTKQQVLVVDDIEKVEESFKIVRED